MARVDTATESKLVTPGDHPQQYPIPVKINLPTSCPLVQPTPTSNDLHTSVVTNPECPSLLCLKGRAAGAPVQPQCHCANPRPSCRCSRRFGIGTEMPTAQRSAREPHMRDMIYPRTSLLHGLSPTCHACCVRAHLSVAWSNYAIHVRPS